MKKQQVVELINSGILYISSHDIAPEHAYKVFQLKRALQKAYEQIEDERKEILKSVGFNDEFNENLSAINAKRRKSEPLSMEEEKIVAQSSKMHSKANDLLEQLHKDSLELNIKTIPYDTWRELQKENRNKAVGDKELDLLGGPAEVLLADIFWLGPEADSPAKEEPKKSKK